MNKIAKIAAVGLVFTMLAAVGLGGCAKVDAKSTVRETGLTVRRTAEVLNNLGNIEDKDYKFPDAFDKEFSRTKQIRSKKQYHLQNYASFSDTTYENYLNKLDALYVVCSEISDKNTKIAGKTAQIRELVGVTKDLGKQLYETKDSVENADELYREIQTQSVSTRQDLERLFADRHSIKKQIKKLHESNNMNVDESNKHYEKIMRRIDYRLELLDNVILNLEKLNQKLSSALGMTEGPQTPEVSAEPIFERRQIFFSYPIIGYAVNQ